jgi:hypothetical protein
VSMPVLHPLLPLPQAAADCSPEPIPDRGAEPNLFIAGSPIASLPNCCSTQRNPNACTTTCIATQHLLLNPLLRTGRTAGVVVVVVAAGAGRPSTPCVARPVHVSLGRGQAPPNASPHMLTASSSLANISRQSLLLTTCSLSQRLTTPGTPSAFQSILSLFNWVAHTVRS